MIQQKRSLSGVQHLLVHVNRTACGRANMLGAVKIDENLQHVNCQSCRNSVAFYLLKADLADQIGFHVK